MCLPLPQPTPFYKVFWSYISTMNKTKIQIKINRFSKRANDWIMDVLCYPITYIERKVKRHQTRNTEVYNWAEPCRCKE